MDSYVELEMSTGCFNYYKNIIKRTDSLKEKERAYKKIKTQIAMFYGGNITDLLLDVIIHDAIRVIVESPSQLVPEMESEYPEENIQIYAERDEHNPDVIHGSISRIMGQNGIPNGNILYYKEGEVARSYNYYKGILTMKMKIDGIEYTKEAEIVGETIIYKVTQKIGENATTKIIDTDMYNIQDVLKVYIEQYKNPRIVLLFPEIFERVSFDRTKVSTRK